MNMVHEWHQDVVGIAPREIRLRVLRISLNDMAPLRDVEVANPPGDDCYLHHETAFVVHRVPYPRGEKVGVPKGKGDVVGKDTLGRGTKRQSIASMR